MLNDRLESTEVRLQQTQKELEQAESKNNLKEEDVTMSEVTTTGPSSSSSNITTNVETMKPPISTLEANPIINVSRNIIMFL